MTSGDCKVFQNYLHPISPRNNDVIIDKGVSFKTSFSKKYC